MGGLRGGAILEGHEWVNIKKIGEDHYLQISK